MENSGLFQPDINVRVMLILCLEREKSLFQWCANMFCTILDYPTKTASLRLLTSPSTLFSAYFCLFLTHVGLVTPHSFFLY